MTISASKRQSRHKTRPNPSSFIYCIYAIRCVIPPSIRNFHSYWNTSMTEISSCVKWNLSTGYDPFRTVNSMQPQSSSTRGAKNVNAVRVQTGESWQTSFLFGLRKSYCYNRPLCGVSDIGASRPPWFELNMFVSQQPVHPLLARKAITPGSSALC